MTQTFVNELGSIVVIARSNHDSPNDKGDGMIGDMPLLHIGQSSSFWIERDDQEEECINSLFNLARLQYMTRVQSLSSTSVPEAEMKLIPFEERKTVRQVYLND